MSTALDGNAIGGQLYDVFGAEMLRKCSDRESYRLSLVRVR